MQEKGFSSHSSYSLSKLAMQMFTIGGTRSETCVLMQEKGFSSHSSYSLSKLAMQMFTVGGTRFESLCACAGEGFSSHSSYSLSKLAMPVFTVNGVNGVKPEMCVLMQEKGFSSHSSYSLSKLAMQMFTAELADRMTGQGPPAINCWCDVCLCYDGNCLHFGALPRWSEMRS